jgi:hypothetical protein
MARDLWLSYSSHAWVESWMMELAADLQFQDAPQSPPARKMSGCPAVLSDFKWFDRRIAYKSHQISVLD